LTELWKNKKVDVFLGHRVCMLLCCLLGVMKDDEMMTTMIRDAQDLSINCSIFIIIIILYCAEKAARENMHYSMNRDVKMWKCRRPGKVAC